MLIKARIVAWFLLHLIAAGLAARTFKMATLTPENSPWTQTLKQFAQSTAQDTAGRVQFKIFAGGVAGEEGDVLRKIKIGQLDGAILSAIGASQVAPSSLVMSLPFLIENTDQLNRIIAQAPVLFNQEGRDRGYEILSWAFSGWVYFFSKKKIQQVEDLAHINIAISVGQASLAGGWLELKANPRQLAFLDTPTGLQNGLVDTFYSTPTGAVAFQWFALAGNMTDLPLAPLTGAVIFSSRQWASIAAADQQILLQQLTKVKEDFQQQSIELDRRAVEIMLQNKLTIIPVSPAERQRWKEAFATRAYPFLVGENKSVSPQLYQRIQQIIAPS